MKRIDPITLKGRSTVVHKVSKRVNIVPDTQQAQQVEQFCATFVNQYTKECTKSRQQNRVPVKG